MIPNQLIQAMIDKPMPAFHYHGQVLAVYKKGLVAADLTDAGLKLVAPMVANFSLVPIGFLVVVISAAITGLTDLRISTTASTPVDVLTIAQANLTSGSKHDPQGANSVLGAGFLAPGAAGGGLILRKTGGAAAGAFTLDVMVTFALRG